MKAVHYVALLIVLSIFDVKIIQAQSFPVQENQRVSALENKVADLQRQTSSDSGEGIAGVEILFAAFCALWAQNTGRSAWLWFFLGLLFSVVTVIVLLKKNSNDGKRWRPA